MCLPGQRRCFGLLPSSLLLMHPRIPLPLPAPHWRSTLEQLGIPVLASERGDEHPLVFGGGPVLTANPEPYADFFDIVLLGARAVWVGPLQEASSQHMGFVRAGAVAC